MLSSIEVAGTNLYRTAVMNSASGKIVAAAREDARDFVNDDFCSNNSSCLRGWILD